MEIFLYLIVYMFIGGLYYGSQNVKKEEAMVCFFMALFWPIFLPMQLGSAVVIFFRTL